MAIVWLLLAAIAIAVGFLYLAMMDVRANRQKKEQADEINRLKQEAAGSPEKLRLIEMREMELSLVNRIVDKIENILRDEHSDDIYRGAFKKDTKPGIGELVAAIEDGYQPNADDDRVSGMIRKLAEDPDLAFLLKHGVHKEVQLRYELKVKNTAKPTNWRN